MNGVASTAPLETFRRASEWGAPVLGREVTDRLIETIYAIEQVPDVRSLRPMLRSG